jgi:hypothetical protein
LSSVTLAAVLAQRCRQRRKFKGPASSEACPREAGRQEPTRRQTRVGVQLKSRTLSKKTRLRQALLAQMSQRRRTICMALQPRSPWTGILTVGDASQQTLLLACRQARLYVSRVAPVSRLPSAICATHDLPVVRMALYVNRIQMIDPPRLYEHGRKCILTTQRCVQRNRSLAIASV